MEAPDCLWKDEKKKAFLFFFVWLLVVCSHRGRGEMVQKETKMAVMFVLVGK